MFNAVIDDFPDWMQHSVEPWKYKRPSLAEKRAARAGLKRWPACHGHPNDLETLTVLESLLESEGALAPFPDNLERHGCWWLTLSGPESRRSISSKHLLALYGAADGNRDGLMASLAYLETAPDQCGALHVARRVRSSFLRAKIEEVLRWARQHGVSLFGWRPDALHALSRLQEDYRWALSSAVHASREGVVCTALNWPALKAARQSTPAKLSFMPARLVWWRITGVNLPRGIQLPSMQGFKFGTLRQLVAEFNLRIDRPDESLVGGWLQAFCSLVGLFDSYGAVQSFVAKGFEWSLKGIHDAGQFRLPPESDLWTPSKWAPLCLRHPRAVEFAHHFSRLEQKNLTPNSLLALRRSVAQVDYPRVTKKWKTLAEVCFGAGLSGPEFDFYRDFWRKVAPKPADFLPNVMVHGDDVGLPGWTLRKLPTDDYRGPMLGVLTGCCQHLMGAGRACAENGVTSPFSAFYIFERNNRLVAQSWIWRNAAGDLVIDSIEAIDRSRDVINAVAGLLTAAQGQLLSIALGVGCVYLGDTSSGITLDVGNQMGLYGQGAIEAFQGHEGYLNSEKSTPADDCGYFDGRDHCLVYGEPNPSVTALPCVENYQRAANIQLYTVGGEPFTPPDDLSDRILATTDGHVITSHRELDLAMRMGADIRVICFEDGLFA